MFVLGLCLSHLVLASAVLTNNTKNAIDKLTRDGHNSEEYLKNFASDSVAQLLFDSEAILGTVASEELYLDAQVFDGVSGAGRVLFCAKVAPRS